MSTHIYDNMNTEETIRTTVVLPKYMHKLLRQMAIEEETTMAEIIQNFLLEGLKKRGEII